jgi:hypothetical protein
MPRDKRRLDDLTEFARWEVAAADIEPWAATITAMTDVGVVGACDALSREEALWMLTLYNTTDDILSACRIAEVAPSVHAWPGVGRSGRDAVAGVRLSGERRNLYGGRILRRMDSYAAAVGSQPQAQWFAEALPSWDPLVNFTQMMGWLRKVWGVGRLAAFEWAEFLHKIDGRPLESDDGALWESSGPRESLEKIHGRAARDGRELTDWAWTVKLHLAEEGVPLSWWDFETVICDFNVMTKGRYYPGKHLAMISEEIAGLPERFRGRWQEAYEDVVPPAWLEVRPGVDKDLCRAYATTGRIHTPLNRSAYS